MIDSSGVDPERSIRRLMGDWEQGTYHGETRMKDTPDQVPGSFEAVARVTPASSEAELVRRLQDSQQPDRPTFQP